MGMMYGEIYKDTLSPVIYVIVCRHLSTLIRMGLWNSARWTRRAERIAIGNTAIVNAALATAEPVNTDLTCFPLQFSFRWDKLGCR